MKTKEKQRVFLDGVEYSRIVRRLIGDHTGDQGEVDISGVRYYVKFNISAETWHVTGRRTSHRKRISISPKTRKAALERDNHMCLMCGSTEDLELDHIKPHINGGSSDIENLQTRFVATAMQQKALVVHLPQNCEVVMGDTGIHIVNEHWQAVLFIRFYDVVIHTNRSQKRPIYHNNLSQSWQ